MTHEHRDQHRQTPFEADRRSATECVLKVLFSTRLTLPFEHSQLLIRELRDQGESDAQTDHEEHESAAPSSEAETVITCQEDLDPFMLTHPLLPQGSLAKLAVAGIATGVPIARGFRM